MVAENDAIETTVETVATVETEETAVAASDSRLTIDAPSVAKHLARVVTTTAEPSPRSRSTSASATAQKPVASWRSSAARAA
jgi:hypothetical protein